MTIESELMQKRQEVREEILALKDQIPSARIFNRLGLVFKRNSLGYWLLSIVLLNLILAGPWISVGLILNEFKRTTPIIGEILFAMISIPSALVVAHIAAQYLLNDLANRIVKQINNTNDLSKILRWLDQSLSMKTAYGYAVPFALIWTVLGIPALNVPAQQFVGYGLSLSTFLIGLVIGLIVHIYIWACLLVSHLKEYQYEMNAFSPSDSEILSDISESLTRAIYVLAGLFAVTTLLFTSRLINEQTRNIIIIPFAVFGWIIILIQFLLTRSTLRTITDRAKWKTLNRIRDQINALEATGDLSDKDTAERLFRLADIHKQIMASNTKTFDLKSVTTLFSQLMLPLLGLLLGNIDKVLELLRK